MDAKISVYVIYVEAILYLMLYNLHDCTFNLLRWYILWTDSFLKNIHLNKYFLRHHSEDLFLKFS